MSRGRQLFRQADVTKAIKAAVAAGLPVARVEIEGGRIIVIAGRPEQDAGTAEPDLDQELADFEASHGQD
ncbi:hypothetical protein [Bradyrhizobium vignae]|uniref:hypothetical protein n=1 Tax=Bradyrhizobium vignae TaxID=1549949 RepID=UPI00100BC056|nr:hypothetical protein [Bradyrhizobium vignae]RXG84284.1 hypothetical protein EAV90_37390 [Bradyrhizobium vignae]